ncbi:MAG TPA: hypothetical protein VMZ91_01975 [Candidatus Paceibacterota bacterium]|nr:hypothetical protein [Candidatus Paceibacterota bacterium]
MNLTERIKILTDVITFPVSKTAAALQIESDEIYNFENSGFGDLDIFLRADLADKIVNTLTIKLYVSYDKGTTWTWVADYADLANGAAVPISAIKNAVLAYAPRIKLIANFDGSATLTATHGCGVDLRIKESDVDYRRDITVQAAPATQAINLTTYGTAIYIDEAYSDVRKIVVASTLIDNSKVTNNVTWKVQSSYDGTNWFDATGAQADILAAAASFAEVEVTTKLGKYIRLAYITDGTGELAAGHGIYHVIIAMY